jgi:hypothetical protein
MKNVRDHYLTTHIGQKFPVAMIHEKNPGFKKALNYLNGDHASLAKPTARTLTRWLDEQSEYQELKSHAYSQAYREERVMKIAVYCGKVAYRRKNPSEDIDV